MRTTPRFAFSFLMIIAYVLGGSLAVGQDYPVRPITLVAANAPGSLLDIIARIMAPQMSKALGQPIVVENKTGAGQRIGYEHVAKRMPSDGYTLLIGAVSSFALLPITVKDLQFDPMKDLPPVIGLVEGRLVLGSSSKLPWKTLNEMAANARANPGKLNWASNSPQTQFPLDALLRDLGLNIVYVPYSDGGRYIQALAAGEVHMGMLGEGQVISLGEKFRPLAVTGDQRATSLRDVPTFAELGHTQVRGLNYSLNVRVGTPKNAIAKIYTAASGALKQPDVKTLFGNAQLEIAEQSSEAVTKNILDQAKVFAAVAKRAGIQPQ